MPTPAIDRLRLYALETKYEYLQRVRLRAYVMFALGFPILFYTLFATIFTRGSNASSVPFSAYYLATYGAFSVISTALFTFGVGLATERGQGWLLFKRATPMPIEAHFVAKILVSLLLSATIVVVLTACGVLFVGLRLPIAVWARLASTLVAGAIPFCAMGLAIGYWAGPNSAPGLANLINMPMAIVSGLWIPFEFLPAALKRIAPWTPAYHFGQLSLGALGFAPDGTVTGHVAALAAFSALGLIIAATGYRRDNDATYG